MIVSKKTVFLDDQSLTKNIQISMNTDRRNFIKTSAIAAGMMGFGAFDNSCYGRDNAAKKVPLNLSFKENIPPGKDLNEKFDYMEKLGIVGFEPGGRDLTGRFNEIQQALRNRKIKVNAITAGFTGWLIAEDVEKRKECLKTAKEIIAAAGELGSTGMILVPGFTRDQPSLPMPQSREVLIEHLKELGEFALKHKTTVILEPLNRRETWYLRLVADATAMAKDTGCPGITVMGDFWHMTWEEPSDYGAFMSAGKYLRHVHVASRADRKMPGEDGEADKYMDGFRALKQMNYPYYVSFECGTKGEREVTVPAAVKLLREQWAKS